jgi:hypothetical protein
VIALPWNVGELHSAGSRLDRMTHSKVSAKGGIRIRLLLAVMVAVLASLTLHHGAMARGGEFERQAITSSSHHAGGACIADCRSDDHSMPVCCGMGLCLSSMPVDPGDMLPVMLGADAHAYVLVPTPEWLLQRIDRPPKDFREV